MSLLQADLPSEDEADDDYDPSKDKTGDEAGASNGKGKQAGTKRRRGSAAYPEASAEGEPDTEPALEVAELELPANTRGKEKADKLWSQLNKNSTKASPVKAASSGTAALQTAPPGASSKQPFNLSSVCRPVTKKQKAGSDTDWMRQLGIKAKPKTSDDQDNAKRAAAAAAAASAGVSAGPNMVTETRRFAGKDIEYKRTATERDKDTSKTQDIKKGGLDALLGSLQQAKKVNVLDKSRMDWGDFKSSDVKVDEELEGYKKSGNKYLDKVDFLNRAELRQYEQERDQRLSQDMRARGRL